MTGLKNFSIKVDKDIYWISRSVGVVLIAIFKYRGEKYILANKRGIGAGNHIGLWNLPCGYLDYNETGEMAASRETKEETGVYVPPERLEVHSIDTHPAQYNQNIVIRYKWTQRIDMMTDITDQFTFANTEPNEVEEIQLIPLSRIREYKWAFDHLYLLKNL